MPENIPSVGVDHDSDEVDLHIAAKGKAAFHKALADGSSPSEAFAISEGALRAAANGLKVPSEEIDKAWSEALKVFESARATGLSPKTAFEVAMKAASTASVTVALDGEDDTPPEYSPVTNPAPHVDRVTSSETP